MIYRRLVALVAGGTLLLGLSPAVAQSAGTVSVSANAFAPGEVAVDAGGTVTWFVQEGGHTIKADDGRFHFRGGDGATLLPGATVSFTFTGTDEYVRYFCEIHGGAGGQGMAGRVRVGAPPMPPPSPRPVIRVPDDAPTLAAAVARAQPGHRIEIGPGDHAVLEPVVIDVDGITIAGADPSSRVVPGVGPRGFPSSAMRITGSRVRVEHLQVAAFRTAGIHLDGANSAEVVDVRVDGDEFTLDGIAVTGVTGATLRGITTTGNRRSGVRVADCAACGVLVDGTYSSANDAGLLVEGARGILARRSSFSGNSAGVVVRAVRTTTPTRSAVVSLVDNIVSANLGVGIRLTGVTDGVVARNVVVGSADGIVVAGDVAQRTSVHENVVDGSLLWDGVGIDVIFADNRDSDDLAKDPTIDPTAFVL